MIDFEGRAGDKTQVVDCEDDGIENGFIGMVKRAVDEDVIAGNRSRHGSVFKQN